MKIINLLSASLLMVSPFTFAETESEEGFDSHEVNLKANRGLATTGGGIKFATYGASTAQRVSSNYAYSYAGAGCLTNESASATFLDESLNLPVGSKIVSVGLFYRDTNEGGTTLLLYKFDAAGGLVTESSLTGTAASGSASVGDFLWLDTTPSDSMLARFSMNAAPSANVCMARIGYIPYDIADEVIFATKFAY